MSYHYCGGSGGLVPSIHKSTYDPAHYFYFSVYYSLLFVACFVGVITFTVNSVEQFLKGSELYRQNLIATVSDLLNRVQEHGIRVDKNAIVSYLHDLPVFNWVRNVGGKLFSLFSNFTLIVLFMTFFLFGSKKTPSITNPAIKEMLSNVSVYLSVKLMA